MTYSQHPFWLASRMHRLDFDPHNCILFAVSMFLKYGGKIVARKSPRGWWFHLWWTPDGEKFWEYTPINPRYDLRVPPMWYRGHVRVSTGPT